MTSLDHASLDAESRALCMYLVGVEPTDYVRDRYRDAHGASSALTAFDSSLFDRFLVAVARRGAAMTRVADAYASLFSRTGLLRRKLTVMLALLESTAPSHQHIDAVTETSRVALVGRVAAMITLQVVLAAAAAVVLLPLQIALGWKSTAPSRERR